MFPAKWFRLIALLASLAASAGVAEAVEISARLSADRIEAGTSTTLLVTVRDPAGSVSEPQVDVPDGLEVLGTSRAQSYSWINGKSTSEVTFRIEIVGLDAGRYSIGPIRVTVGSQMHMGGTRALVVTTAPVGGAGASGPSRGGDGTSGASSGSGAASLQLSLEPREPWVGQLCRLTVRLVQRVEMAEDSQYESPATPGFWTEGWSDPQQYTAREGGRNVLVVERHQRIYPLAAGRGTLGPARGRVTPVAGGLPSLVFGGGRALDIRSPAIDVRVRPLPTGAPAGFDGGVGTFAPSWSCARSHTTTDQPVAVTLDVRGVGNLPLLHAPKLSGADFEVFGSTTEDSLGTAGAAAAGRRRFSWTVLPRRTGRVQIAAPSFAWFDPATGAYRSLSASPLDLDVAAAVPGAGEDDAFPKAFSSHRPAPGASAARPWALLVCGLAAGAAALFVRRARASAPDAPERARQREWLRAVGLARGPDFWRAADEAATWVESRGQRVMRLREEISAARFGGAVTAEDDVRRRLVERIAEALPAEMPRTTPWYAAAGCVALALVALAVGVPGRADGRLAARIAAADQMAREGKLEAAAAEWTRVADATGDPDVAARLAWVAMQHDDVANAAARVVAAEAGEARRPALAWMTERVREAGGLVGLEGRPLPLTSWEWGALAAALALGAALEWPRRRRSALLLALAVLAASAWPAQQLWLRTPPQRAVSRELTLDEAGVDLQPGQVVRLVRSEGGRLRVRAAAGVEGWIPADGLVPGARDR